MQKPTFEIEKVTFESEKWKEECAKLYCSPTLGYMELQDFISNLLEQQKKDFIENEIKYWKDVFDNRPKDRDLESDNIAQNFARIEIERLESMQPNLER